MCENRTLKSWNHIKREFMLNNNLQFKYMQLVNAIPATWKLKICEDQPIPDLELAKHTQGILLCTRLIPIENLNSKQIYDIIAKKWQPHSNSSKNFATKIS